MTTDTLSTTSRNAATQTVTVGVTYRALINRLGTALRKIAIGDLPCATRRELLSTLLDVLPPAERDSHVRTVKTLGLRYKNEILDYPIRRTMPDGAELDAAICDAATAWAHATADSVITHRATESTEGT